MTLKIALLGIGTMGRNHLRVLSMLKDVKITKIFDVNHELLIRLSKEYDIPWTTDACDALDGADAAVIVTPTSTHYEYFKLCADAVKHIFIEKPLASTYQDALDMKAIADERGLFVQCGFIERFNPVVVALKNVLAHESVLNIDLTRTNRLSNRITDVDVVLDLMIHDIDLALYLNGPIEKIRAFGKKEHGLISFASAIAQHSNGSLSRLLASRMTEKKMRSIEVTTEHSFLEADLLKKELKIHKQSQISQEQGSPYVISALEHDVAIKQQEALLAEHQAFIAGCRGEPVDVPDINAGLNSLNVSQLILEQINRM